MTCLWVGAWMKRMPKNQGLSWHAEPRNLYNCVHDMLHRASDRAHDMLNGDVMKRPPTKGDKDHRRAWMPLTSPMALMTCLTQSSDCAHDVLYGDGMMRQPRKENLGHWVTWKPMTFPIALIKCSMQTAPTVLMTCSVAVACKGRQGKKTRFGAVRGSP